MINEFQSSCSGILLEYAKNLEKKILLMPSWTTHSGISRVTKPFIPSQFRQSRNNGLIGTSPDSADRSSKGPSSNNRFGP
mmetsp:Transcript_2515/g.3504  ORF Transcript_2515/g.3504 Transcript_2515/m.3504 type:complete len:80 (+) Transcript_2515:574-813(+)